MRCSCMAKANTFDPSTSTAFSATQSAHVNSMDTVNAVSLFLLIVSVVLGLSVLAVSVIVLRILAGVRLLKAKNGSEA